VNAEGADIVRICPLARETAGNENDDNDVAALVELLGPDGKTDSKQKEKQKKTHSNNTVYIHT
jgi:hypothetical protein